MKEWPPRGTGGQQTDQFPVALSGDIMAEGDPIRLSKSTDLPDVFLVRFGSGFGVVPGFCGG